MDELKETVETLIDIDEPEALLSTLRRAAERKAGHRWQRLAKALKQAETSLEDKPGKPIHTSYNTPAGSPDWIEDQPKAQDGHPSPAEAEPLPEEAKAE